MMENHNNLINEKYMQPHMHIHTRTHMHTLSINAHFHNEMDAIT